MSDATHTLILLRHGESEWNAKNLFTGWVDVPLTDKGRAEAVSGGEQLVEAGLLPDVVHTSLLRRAITTAHLALDVAERHWIPVRRSWRLNERHYGALQGLSKAEITAKFGEQQVLLWRRSFDVPPPPLAADDPRTLRDDPRYAALSADELPLTECLKDTIARFLPLWNEQIAPAIARGERILIVAHGNSLRALIKYLDNMSEEQIIDENVPTGAPLVYELDDQLQPLRRYYLGDPRAVRAAMQKVVEQGKHGA